MKGLTHTSRSIVWGIILVSILTSCSRTEIPRSELPEFKDKIVVNARLDNINNIEIEVSNSAGAYTSNLPEVVSDAVIVLTSSTSEIPLTYSSTKRKYVTNVSAKPGEKYVVVVSRKNYAGVNAQCVIPPKLSNKTAGFIENGGIDADGLPSDKLFVKFDDLAGKNYYIAHFYYYSQSADLFIPFDFELTDPTLKSQSTIKLIDGGYLFTDELFDGKTKDLSVVAPRGLVAGNTGIKYVIDLRSISSDYYKYQTTLKQYQDNQDQQNNGPFGSSVIVHSNINGGLGAFISSTLESDTLR